MMKRWMLSAAFLGLALPVAAPATTLVLMDFNATEGDRVTSSPYVDQELERMTRQGLIRPIVIHVDDNGGKRTDVIDMQTPATPPPLGVGVRILTGSVQWHVTTERAGNQINYQIDIRTSQGFTNGMGPPTQVTNGGANLVGVANISADGAPAIARRYSTPGGMRMMVGVLRP